MATGVFTRITPAKGSPVGRVILNGSEEHDNFDEPTIPDVEFGNEPTVCHCGAPFHEHDHEELTYLSEHNRCLRLAKKV